MRGVVFAATLLAAMVGPALAADLPACPSNRAPPLVLDHLRDKIATNHEATIVALGSSSTEGSQASDVAHTYPALLQADLNTALPTAHIAIINRGVGGQDVAEMLARIETDALAVHPQLVIWQVGANGAMRGVAPDLFKRLLTAGIKRLKAAHVDVVLMDNQRAPLILAAKDHNEIDQIMAEVAQANGAGLFARSALMDQWRVSGFPYDRFMSGDGLHQNDYGYRCVAAALSAAIVEGLKPAASPAQTTAKK